MEKNGILESLLYVDANRNIAFDPVKECATI
jgi:hypothetical protein